MGALEIVLEHLYFANKEPKIGGKGKAERVCFQNKREGVNKGYQQHWRLRKRTSKNRKKKNLVIKGKGCNFGLM